MRLIPIVTTLGSLAYAKESNKLDCKNLLPNDDVINKDGTIRPAYNSDLCAATTSLRNAAVLKWVNCEDIDGENYFGNFYYDFEEFAYDWHPDYQGVNETIKIGQIKSADHEDRCWTIRSANRATAKNSNIFLKKCDPELYKSRQSWSIGDGHILLANDVDDTGRMHKKF